MEIIMTDSTFSNEDYSTVLNKSMLFYYAQRAGNLPDDNPIEWRGDSVLNDGSDVGRDLSGGWFDAGDNLKLGFPMASAATMLAWGGVSFEEGYSSTGAKIDLVSHLKWVNDYFLNAYDDKNTETIADDVFHGQVGKVSVDHDHWGAVEDLPDDMYRPTYSIDKDNPGSDLAAETAAAMASSSIVFRAEGMDEYADLLVEKSISLYNFAETYRGKYSNSIPDAKEVYGSNEYVDELGWGAAWVYKATGDSSYLDKAEDYAQQKNLAYPNWTLNWSDKAYGLNLILLEETGKDIYVNRIEKHLNYWMSDKITHTPGTETNDGLAWIDSWGSNRYAANTAFLATEYAKYLFNNGINIEYANTLVDFATDQIDYMLGDNPDGQSFVVGFGDKSPLNPHHANASGYTNWGEPGSEKHILEGALVGGPDKYGNYNDSQDDYIQNEVAVDYNAGFSGALAGLYELRSKITVENNAPHNLSLGNDNVDEGMIGGVIGIVTVGDADQNDSHTFTISDSRFEIVGGELKLKDGVSLDFESEEEITINIIATDSGGLSFSKDFVIDVISVDDDKIIGGTENDDTLNGVAGNDTIYSYDGDDFVNGNDGNDYIDAGDGNDGINAGSGNDTIYGGLGDDHLIGGDGNDYLIAGAGNDLLKSQEEGNDYLYGGTGDDIFQFHDDSTGFKAIMDFTAGEDMIQIFNTVEIFSELEIKDNSDGNVVIWFEGFNITLNGVQTDEVQESWFEFSEFV
jgi:Ca2+-binding RTX toxin-like protein